jgi:hypothetical protein
LVSQAETIKNSIQTNWALTGLLSKTESATMKETVRFFDRDQVLGNEVVKAVVVRKINDEGDENIVRHPKFLEVTDVYMITVYYRVTDVNPDTFSVAMTNVEDMAKEVQRIIRITYDPLAGIGSYFISRSSWSKNDFVEQAQPELRRTLQLELTQIKSGSTEVFKGYGGVLAFDTSESVADSKLGSDYIYTEAYDVEIEEGFESMSYLTNDVSLGQNTPQRFSGKFGGTFRAEMYLKKSDVNASTVERLHKLYRLQASSPLNKELPTIALFHAETNTEGTIKTLTNISYIHVTNIRKLSQLDQLTRYFLTGTILKPTSWAIT